MAFYLKYRSQNFSELDNSDVRESLKQIVMSGKIPHAFLFSGPKGTGKTSAARIIAKTVNCESTSLKLRGPGKAEPCNKCAQCISINKGNNLDVIELDAASHRGIEDARSLRDAVKLAPARARKKVYIIDEAHMLTTEASNALLKTLEEPPSHVVFILATTNPEKLIETIRSRTTNIAFSKAKPEELVRSLERVLKGEKLKMDKESLLLIAKKAGGSFRDAVKILEQLVSEKISLKPINIQKYLFGSAPMGVDSFLEILAEKNAQKAIFEVEKLVSSGGGVERFIETILERLNLALLAMVGVGGESLEGFTKNDLIKLSELFFRAVRDISFSPIEQLPLEIAIVKWCFGDKEEEEQKLEVPIKRTPNLKGNNIPKDKNIDDGVWRDILSKIRPVNTSIEALLRAARPMSFDGKILTLSVYYRFHKERLEEVHHRKVLEDIVAAVLGNPVRVVCTLTEPPVKVEAPSLAPSGGVLTEGEDKDIIKIADEIFGN